MVSLVRLTAKDVLADEHVIASRIGEVNRLIASEPVVMFGMRGLYSIVLGANNQTDDTQLMQQQMGMGGAQPGQQPDMGKIFAAEAENLQLVEHAWFLDGAEERLLKGNQRAALAADKKKN